MARAVLSSSLATPRTTCFSLRRISPIAGTDTSKPLSVAVQLDFDGGDLYGGNFRKWGGLTWQPRENLSMTVGVSHTDLDGWLLHQEDQNFTTFSGDRWEPDLSLDFYPTSAQQLRIKLQWVGIEAFEDRFYTLQSDPGRLIEGLFS